MLTFYLTNLDATPETCVNCLFASKIHLRKLTQSKISLDVEQDRKFFKKTYANTKTTNSCYELFDDDDDDDEIKSRRPLLVNFIIKDIYKHQQTH